MSSFLTDTQLPPLPQGVDALQQQPVNPQQPEPSGATRPPATQGPLPGPDTSPTVGQNDKSTPLYQFRRQAERECDKLSHQRRAMQAGRRQTLPWDDSFDLHGNAYNNVRRRWIEQGIWREQWDQDWVWERERRDQLNHTFPRLQKPAASRSKPDLHWGHEKAGPGPDSAPELGPKPCPPFEIWVAGPDLPRHPITTKQGRLGSFPWYFLPRATARNPEASRSYRQFLHQIAQEREWIKDQVDHQAPGADFDPDAMAY